MFTRLLVPLDRSPLAEQAVDRAGAIARACHAAVDVVLVHPAEQMTTFGDEARWDASQLEAEKQYVHNVADQFATSASVPTTHAVLEGDVVASIVARTRKVGADLVVMTSHGRTGFSRAWLGSIADGVIRQSAIPVLMLRSAEGSTTRLAPDELFRKILVPIDGSPESLGVLDAAAALARCSKARLVLLEVVQPVPLVTVDSSIAAVYPSLMPDEVATAGLVDASRHYVADVAHMLAKQGCTDVEQHVITANGVAQAVLDFARTCGADAIAMSTHGRGASRLLIGSMADKVVRASTVPVLLYRPGAVHAAEPIGEQTRALPSPLFSIA